MPPTVEPAAAPVVETAAVAATRHGVLLVAAVAIVVHAAGLWGGYAFDDFAAVLGHPAVTGQAPLSDVFTREYWGRPLAAGWSSSYRPITTLTYALEHRLTAAPWLHHLVNLLLYGGLCGIVVAFLRRHLPATQAVVAGLLFAIWPIHVENVASIVGRADVIAAALSLVALLCVDRGTAAGVLSDAENRVNTKFSPARWTAAAAWPLVGAGAYLLALLSKEGVALLPGVAAWLLVVRWRQGALSGRRWLPPVIAVAALAGTGLLYLGLRQRWLPVGLPAGFVGADNALRSLHGPARWWANLALLGTYGEIATVPIRLCVDHTYGDVMPPAGAVAEQLSAWRAWLGVAVASWLLWDGWRSWRGRSAGLAVAFGLSYLLVGQWLIDLSVTFAERLFLWPSVFAAGALVSVVARLLRGQPARTRRRLVVAFVALGVVYAGRSVDRSLDWRSELQLYRSSARACPAAVHNRLSLAKAWQRAGRPDEALWNYALALAGHRRFPARFAPPAFAVEHVEPLASRLRRLPSLVDLGGDPAQLWPALADWLERRGATDEAALARALAPASGAVRSGTARSGARQGGHRGSR